MKCQSITGQFAHTHSHLGPIHIRQSTNMLVDCMFREVGGNQRTCRKNSRQQVTLVQDQIRDVYGNNAILWASCYNLVAVKTRHTTILCKHTLPSSDVLPICLIRPRSCLELGDLGRHKGSETSKSTYN